MQSEANRIATEDICAHMDRRESSTAQQPTIWTTSLRTAYVRVASSLYPPRSAGDNSRSSKRYSSVKPPPVSYPDSPIPIPWIPLVPMRTDVNLTTEENNKQRERKNRKWWDMLRGKILWYMVA